MSTTVSFANSAGWPSRCPAIVSQPAVLVAVPAPEPSPTSSATSSTIVNAYAGHASAIRSAEPTRGSPRTRATMPTTIQTACGLYAPVAGVVTSVCPAENTIASP